MQYKGGYAPAYSGDPNYCNTTFTEMYSYTQAGGLLKKRLQMTRSSITNLDATYTYDNEARRVRVPGRDAGRLLAPRDRLGAGPHDGR